MKPKKEILYLDIVRVRRDCVDHYLFIYRIVYTFVSIEKPPTPNLVKSGSQTLYVVLIVVVITREPKLVTNCQIC